MTVLVSACLLGENCKYSGGNNLCPEVVRFTEGHRVVSVCPEVLGGLPVPRLPAEIVGGTVTAADGSFVDGAFRSGARRALEIALKEHVDLAILQPRSPSCGSRQVYDGTFSKTLIDGQGVFAALLLKNGIRVIDADMLGTVSL